MKDFCFTLANGSTTRITLDAHTHDALSRTCTRAWDETLDDIDAKANRFETLGSRNRRRLSQIPLAPVYMYTRLHGTFA